ncbi:zf-TFIIB domain-containing protein [Salinibacterium soli]|uniref:Zf-TFIIB domain-containing protein n=1 Tax=Antiquaquibacter soli TaxID=3064523 RepID=A0ABT9BMK0_9MICO|nr:zf-TFIIB domain-containing protein [Protaetiibacter sp. WY-16]MDO7882256.1 zf-TFIIB domain-containing protein [Protaetiibacter sp. WY-16]
MKCPTDSATLVMSERNGIEIDYCPECRGVWLDRGELDKIIDRAGAAASAPQAPAYQPPAPQYREQGYGQGHNGYAQPYRKKKDNWLSELFD